MGEKRLSSIALINIERGYANCVINEDMEKMINIFGKRKGRNTYFFNVQFIEKSNDELIFCRLDLEPVVRKAF